MAAATEPHCTAGAIAFQSHLVASEERQELPPANAVGGAGPEDGRVDRRRHDEIAVASERVTHSERTMNSERTCAAAPAIGRVRRDT
jgi:hypothetical protein